MSGWEGFYEEPAVPARKRKSPLPEVNKVARMMRSGRTLNDLALRYGVTDTFIVQQLTSNGWDPSNGKWTGGDKKSFRPAPLSVRGPGPGKACHHVGGGDNPNVVPLVSRPFQQRPKPAGFAWPARPDAEPRVSTPKPPIYRRPRTFAQLREANAARQKLSNEDRQEIARRYVQDLVASTILARDYHVNQRTIRKALIREGVTIRTRAEAGKARWQNEHGGAA